MISAGELLDEISYSSAKIIVETLNTINGHTPRKTNFILTYNFTVVFSDVRYVRIESWRHCAYFGRWHCHRKSHAFFISAWTREWVILGYWNRNDTHTRARAHARIRTRPPHTLGRSGMFVTLGKLSKWQIDDVMQMTSRMACNARHCSPHH